MPSRGKSQPKLPTMNTQSNRQKTAAAAEDRNNDDSDVNPTRSNINLFIMWRNIGVGTVVAGAAAHGRYTFSARKINYS